MYLRILALLLKKNITLLKRNVLQAQSIAVVILKVQITFGYVPLRISAAAVLNT